MLKVIGAGLGRTGTNSLQLALQQLGFDKCHHMREVVENPEQVVYWQEALDTGTTDWETLFTGYQAAVDYPVAYFYETMMARYPDAKIILTVRDPERWYQSVKSTIYKLSDIPPLLSILRFVLPSLGRIYPMLRFVRNLVWETHFEGRFEDKDFAIAKFNDWNEKVKATVPAERLLVFEVKQGWQPLCEFLDVPIPDEPFPHVNSTEEFQAMMRQRNPLNRIFNRS